MSDALINGLAGAGGGIIAQLIAYPLQTVNTRQQTKRVVKKKKRKPGTIEQMCQVVNQEGWERLYGGLTPSLVGTATSQGVYYFFYQTFRGKAESIALEKHKKKIGDGSVGILASLIVAALFGCVNVLLTNPIWVVVTRMQSMAIILPVSYIRKQELCFEKIWETSLASWTHTKVSKKDPNRLATPAPEETMPSVIEPFSYGTGNAVCPVGWSI